MHTNLEGNGDNWKRKERRNHLPASFAIGNSRDQGITLKRVVIEMVALGERVGLKAEVKYCTQNADI